MISSILMVPVIITIATGSVVLISKVGGRSAKKKIHDLFENNNEDTKSDNFRNEKK